MRKTVKWLMAALLGTFAAAGAHAAEEVRVVVVANWETGADSGDAPGEYQDWVEREHLDTTVPVRGAPDVLRRNKEGLYGLVMRHGVMDLIAFALDPRFDLSHTYWLFTGISGVDPNAASVGSAAWARWVVDGDWARELDDRSIPKGWPYGIFPIGAQRPNQLPEKPEGMLQEALPLNAGLAYWAFHLSRDVPLGDAPEVAARRAAWKGYPQAQRKPFVLMGETLGATRYWHGERRNRWAEDWVKLWTRGQGLFVMTNEESQLYQRAILALADQGFVDRDRVMVLRTASNFSMPPPGVSETASIGDESPGMALAFDSNQRAGTVVLHELLAHWNRYRGAIPSASP
ncbi:purine-nucleoside phosphorylase [Frateuria defendens]|uniref:purine-nucleoside phosphorylase n=1 Tax=Frateuria defendens TaxID=2219559 RepID=UPI00066FD369|nr:purine nucleoside permease [Frateuria defendens]